MQVSQRVCVRVCTSVSVYSVVVVSLALGLRSSPNSGSLPSGYSGAWLGTRRRTAFPHSKSHLDHCCCMRIGLEFAPQQMPGTQSQLGGLVGLVIFFAFVCVCVCVCVCVALSSAVFLPCIFY